MPEHTVLIVEDDTELRSLLKRQLEKIELSVVEAGDGEEGLALASSEAYSLIILDVDLPKINGFEVCAKLRRRNVTVPVLMLTAKSEEIEIVEGLQSGADDYLTKPFRLAELIARVQALLRRVRPSGQVVRRSLTIGALEIDERTRRAFFQKEELSLTKLEFDVLCLLASNPGKSFSREELLREAWGTEVSGYDSAVNSLILRLRRKLGDDLSEPVYIKSVRGVGYRFCAPDEFPSGHL